MRKGDEPVPADMVSAYLTAITARLRLSPAQKEDIVEELWAHLTDSIRDYETRGLSMEEARNRALADFGDPKAVSRKLNWIHGFGWYSRRPWIDAVLGSILPVLVAWGYSHLQSLFPVLEPYPPITVLFLVAMGVSFYAFRVAVPAWTVTWLGIAHLSVLFVVLGGTAEALRALGFNWLPSYLAGIAAASVVLASTTHWFARRHVELTLLFLLPLTLPYIAAGYQDVAPEHASLIVPSAGLFTALFAFFYLLTRNRHPAVFGCLAFIFYTGLYVDIMLHNPAPFQASGLRLAFLGVALYAVPILLVSSPVYRYWRKISA